jgi:hypothetical protein
LLLVLLQKLNLEKVVVLDTVYVTQEFVSGLKVEGFIVTVLVRIAQIDFLLLFFWLFWLTLCTINVLSGFCDVQNLS